MNAEDRKTVEDAINIVRDELREAGISNMVDGPEKVAKCIDRASRNFHTVAEALGYDWLSGKISSANNQDEESEGSSPSTSSTSH